jgi:hypothetical protein
VNLDEGVLYSSDGNSVIILNAEKSIDRGLVLQKPTSGTNKLAVTTGRATIDGRYYFHLSSGTDIVLPPNNDANHKLYFVYGEPTEVVYSLSGTTAGSYTLGLSFVGITGEDRGPNGVVQKVIDGGVTLPTSAILLGAALFSPMAATASLFPITVVDTENGGKIARESPSDYVRERNDFDAIYETNTLYLENQVLKDTVGKALYIVNATFVSTNISDDEFAGYITIVSGGTGSSGSYTGFGNMLAVWSRACDQVASSERDQMADVKLMQMMNIPTMNPNNSGKVGFSSNGISLKSFKIGNTIYSSMM